MMMMIDGEKIEATTAEDRQFRRAAAMMDRIAAQRPELAAGQVWRVGMSEAEVALLNPEMDDLWSEEPLRLSFRLLVTEVRDTFVKGLMLSGSVDEVMWEEYPQVMNSLGVVKAHLELDFNGEGVLPVLVTAARSRLDKYFGTGQVAGDLQLKDSRSARRLRALLSWAKAEAA